PPPASGRAAHPHVHGAVRRRVARRAATNSRPDRRQAVRRAYREPHADLQGDSRLPVTERALRWFYGLPKLVGIVLALVGVGLYLGGVIGTILVPAIAAGLYLVGALATPRPRPLGLSTGSGLDAGRLEASLDKLIAASGKRLPDDLAAKVSSIG